MLLCSFKISILSLSLSFLPYLHFSRGLCRWTEYKAKQQFSTLSSIGHPTNTNKATTKTYRIWLPHSLPLAHTHQFKLPNIHPVLNRNTEQSREPTIRHTFSSDSGDTRTRNCIDRLLFLPAPTFYSPTPYFGDMVAIMAYMARTCSSKRPNSELAHSPGFWVAIAPSPSFPLYDLCSLLACGRR